MFGNNLVFLNLLLLEAAALRQIPSVEQGKGIADHYLPRTVFPPANRRLPRPFGWED